MNQNYGTPIPPLEEVPSQPQKKNTWLIIVIVVIVVLCCCVAVVVGAGYWLYYNGDKLFGISSLLQSLPAV
jgi:flagellar basal body-associated protein FliL